MAQAGWCSECGAYVWLAEGGGCVKGHDAPHISHVYEAELRDADPFDEAFRQVEAAAERGSAAVRESWEETTPKLKKAWEEARPAVKRAGEAAGRAAEELGAGLRTFSTSVSGRDTRDESPPPPPDDEEPGSSA